MDDAVVSDTTSLDRSEGNSTTALYRAAIGSINTDYFERVFNRFETKDRSGPSWNWASAFITLNWMAFRKLWGAALAYVGALLTAALLVLGIGRLVLRLPPDLEWALMATLGVLSVAIPGFYGNAMFHAACRKRMVEALATHATVEEACAGLLANAVTIKRMLAIALINLVLFGLCFAVYFLLPQAGHMPLQTAKMDSARAVAPVAERVTVAASAPEVPASAPAPAGAASAPVLAIESPVPEMITSAPVLSANVVPPEVAAQPEPEPPKQKPATKSKAKPQTAHETARDTTTGKKYFVNAGLFADENNAHNAHSRLIDADLPAVKSSVTGPRGKFTRVRVGPYETQAEADKVADKIRALKLDAAVVALP